MANSTLLILIAACFAFAAYFLSQNAAIASGKISGKKLNLKTLGIGNGLTVGVSELS